MGGESSGATTVPVMADAQFGNVRVLLPFANFEDRYQAQAGSSMIAFPAGRDPNAGRPGFDPNLMLGHPVPRGARLDIGIPVVFQGNDTVDYRYFIVFRDRTLRDFREPGADRIRPPYHYAKQATGAVDGTLVGTPAMYPIDARFWNIGYEQAEPTLSGLAGGAALHVYPEAIIPRELLALNAILPDGAAAVVQQGIYNPTNVGPGKVTAMRADFQCDANGDDMIILAQKIPDDQGAFVNWDFDGVDQGFSNIYGRGAFTAPPPHDVFLDAGIRVTAGTNP